jgi:hypothetical protein
MQFLLQEMRERFLPDLEAATEGKFDSWQSGYDGLAAVILMDQFSRSDLPLGNTYKWGKIMTTQSVYLQELPVLMSHVHYYHCRTNGPRNNLL